MSGHSHNYERFAPRDGNGKTSAVGIRQFVVGTGGAFMTGLGSSRMAGSEAAQNDTFGVLKLTLHASSYDWQFVPIAGKTWSDSGTTQCHGPAGSPLVPPPPGPTIDRTPPEDHESQGRAAPLQAPDGVPLHALRGCNRQVRAGPPSCRSALPAGREVHAGRGRGSQRASVCVRHRRPASAGREIQGEGRGPRPRRQLLRASESEVPDRSLTSHRPRSTLA